MHCIWWTANLSKQKWLQRRHWASYINWLSVTYYQTFKSFRTQHRKLTPTRGLLLEHTTNDGNMFYKISSKYHTGLISDDWIQSQSVHIIHYTTCGQICRLTLPDRGKNLYSQQNCIPALITTESCLTRSWFYKAVLITSPWVFVYLVPALPWRYRMTGWLNWKLLSYHSASFAWASLHITEGIVCLRERERERERDDRIC